MTRTTEPTQPFGVGIPSADGVRSRTSRAPQVPAPGARGIRNLVAGEAVGSVGGHTYRAASGAVWPRSGAGDVAVVMREFAASEADEAASRPVTSACAEALVIALARDAELHADLDEALGSQRESTHFSPTVEGIVSTVHWLDRNPGQPEIPIGGDVALALHWSEPFAMAAARVLRAAASARCVLIVSDPRLPGLGLSLASGLERAGVDPKRVAVLHDDGLDVIRALAAEAEVTLDVLRPDAFATGLATSLRSLRDAAVDERSEDRAPLPTDDASTDEGAAGGTVDFEGDWFGLGVVERPAAALSVRTSPGCDLVIGDVEVAGLGGAVRLPADDLVEAAEEVVERAFGRGVLGGFATGAVSRVFVERHAFSRFTECLLEVLGDADQDPWFDPPSWAFSDDGRLDRSLPTARRIGLDEDGTLVHERRRKGGQGRARGGNAAFGLVFTNIERRMRLGGSLSVPGVLSLVRGGRGPTL